MNKESRIFVAGHTGLLGSAIIKCLESNGYSHLITATHKALDLTEANSVNQFFISERPEYVILAAGRVGGIFENMRHPVELITTNLSIQLNVLQAAHNVKVEKLIFFGSSCMYPRSAFQPMPEEALMSGSPEQSSLPYAMSKLAGIQMCLAYNQKYGENRFLPIIPGSAYGPNDNFHPMSGHVISALIRKFHDAKESGVPSIKLWGSGNPRREFIHSSDIAHCCLMLLEKNCSNLEFPLNVSSGEEVTIRQLARFVAEVVGYEGEVLWDSTMPDGAERKLLDSNRIMSWGWRPKIELFSGLKLTYQWYLETGLYKNTVS